MTNATTPRAAAWGELHSPTTTGARLAQIAQAHPEFAEAIGRHPHAYPALVAWAGQTAARYPNASVAQAVAPTPAWAPTAGWASAPAPRGSADPTRRRGRGVWIGAVIAYILLPHALWIGVALLPGGGFQFDPSRGYPLWLAALNTWPPLIFAVAAMLSAASGARRLIAAICAVSAFVVQFVQYSLNTGVFTGKMPDPAPWYVQALGIALTVGLMFLAWGLSRPLAGAGFAAVIVVIVLQCLWGLTVWPWAWSVLYQSLSVEAHAPPSVVTVVSNVLAVIAEALVVVITVAVALALSRSSERRALGTERTVYS